MGTTTKGTNQYVETRQGSAYVSVAGRGDPLLLLHQWPRTGRMFRRLIPFLTAERTVISVDTPGCGFSDPMPGEVTIEAMTKWLCEVLDTMAVGRADVFAVHMGACIAVDLSVSAPERVRKLAMFGYPLMLSEADHTELGSMTSDAVTSWTTRGNPAFLLARWQRVVGDLTNRRWLSGRLPTEPFSDEELEFIDSFLFDLGRGQEHSLAVIGAMMRYDSRSKLPQVGAPALHIEADSQFEVGVCQRGGQVAELIPDCRTAVMADADGNAAEWSAQEMASMIMRFFVEEVPQDAQQQAVV